MHFSLLISFIIILAAGVVVYTVARGAYWAADRVAATWLRLQGRKNRAAPATEKSPEPPRNTEGGTSQPTASG